MPIPLANAALGSTLPLNPLAGSAASANRTHLVIAGPDPAIHSIGPSPAETKRHGCPVLYLLTNKEQKRRARSLLGHPAIRCAAKVPSRRVKRTSCIDCLSLPN